MHIAHQPVSTLRAAQLRQLRAMPGHPVHALAMQSMAAQYNGRVPPHHIAQLCEFGRELLLGGREVRVHGYVMWRRVDGWDGRPGPHVKVDYLYVRDTGRGHGTRLLRWLETHEAAADVTVVSTDHARPFYERHGYELEHAHCLRLIKRRT